MHRETIKCLSSRNLGLNKIIVLSGELPKFYRLMITWGISSTIVIHLNSDTEVLVAMFF